MNGKNKLSEIVMLTHPFFNLADRYLFMQPGDIPQLEKTADIMFKHWMKEIDRASLDAGKALIINIPPNQILLNRKQDSIPGAKEFYEKYFKKLEDYAKQRIPRERLLILPHLEEGRVKGNAYDAGKFKEQVSEKTKLTTFGENMFLPGEKEKKGCVPLWAEEISDRLGIPRKNIVFKPEISEPFIISSAEARELAERIALSGGTTEKANVKRVSREEIMKKIRRARR